MIQNIHLSVTLLTTAISFFVSNSATQISHQQRDFVISIPKNSLNWQPTPARRKQTNVIESKKDALAPFFIIAGCMDWFQSGDVFYRCRKRGIEMGEGGHRFFYIGCSSNRSFNLGGKRRRQEVKHWRHGIDDDHPTHSFIG